MRSSSPTTFTLFLLSFADQIRVASGAVSTFFIGDHVEVNQSADPITVRYNRTRFPYALSGCHIMQDSFCIDARADNHPGVTNTSLDLFSQNANELTTVFQTAIDWSAMSTRCILKTINTFANQTIFCNASQANLAVFYNSPYPYRTGPIGFLNNGSVVLCKAGASGFVVAGYMPLPLSTISFTTSPVAQSVFAETAFNLKWLLLIAASVALLIAMIAGCAHKQIRTAAINCYYRFYGSERRLLVELPSVDDTDELQNYGATATQLQS